VVLLGLFNIVLLDYLVGFGQMYGSVFLVGLIVLAVVVGLIWAVGWMVDWW
tara:strand:+ start:178 stop:330 length:153 start_codon:yes stop_codon:yes gene_type:complete